MLGWLWIESLGDPRGKSNPAVRKTELIDSIGYVELDAVELVNRALAVSGIALSLHQRLTFSFLARSSWVSPSASCSPNQRKTEME